MKKLYTFSAESVPEALIKAKAVIGESDPVIESIKEIRKKTLSQSALCEVVLSVELPDEEAREREEEDDVYVALSKAAREISEITKAANLPDRVLPKAKAPAKPSPIAEHAELSAIQKEINKLTDRVKLIQNMMWEKTNEKKIASIPPEFAEIYRVSRQSGMTSEHLDSIISLTLENMPLTMRQESATVRRYFNTLLRKMVPVRIESRLERPKKKVQMLVGPTGVGKTTTLAKLAARFAHKLSEHYKVGIMTLDTYRIGAVEQLTFYAKMMRIGIETVRDPIDFSSALSSLRHCDIVLIDTAGCSQHDKEKIGRIGQFLKAEKETSIDVALVLASNSKLEDLRDIYKNYSPLGIDTVIATKLDETASLGSMFSFVYENKKPLSYLSIGQEVPDDLLPAESDYFISCMLSGFRKEREIA
ncbi:MAG: flagellar biosynthesis protein FlhF [Helicobacteraceae bacterium]|nr:flagellar biosynthesis protein FlhF [Helicobacteraceae bacterium]